ncbi:MAG: hypothetical protein WBL28_11075 [Methylotenera sp.]
MEANTPMIFSRYSSRENDTLPVPFQEEVEEQPFDGNVVSLSRLWNATLAVSSGCTCFSQISYYKYL